MGIVARVAERYIEAAGSRILYHIGKRPPEPKPKRGGWVERGQPGEDWERPWLDESVRSGVFLTPNPIAVAEEHMIFGGHVYAYKVPYWVIKEAKGLHRYDSATEILIPAHLWRHVKFMGKSIDRTEFEKFVIERVDQTHAERSDFYTVYQAWKREKGKPGADKERDEIMRSIY